MEAADHSLCRREFLGMILKNIKIKEYENRNKLSSSTYLRIEC